MIGTKEILKFANSHVGVKEIGSNDGWEDKKFERLMKLTGWEKDHAWCSYFAEACWLVPTYSGKSKYYKGIQTNFSANAVQTYKNFSKDNRFICDQIPEPGAVGIMMKYKNGEPSMIDIWTLGHALIVESIEGEYVHTIEGNTNSAGSRNGDTVGKHKRLISFEPKQNGLVFLGFIKMKDDF